MSDMLKCPVPDNYSLLSHITIPTYFTLARLCIAPLVLPVLFVFLLPYNHIALNTILAIVFVLFSFTDFLDGFLARYYKQESALGKMLDPIADKFLMFSSLIGLLVAQKICFVWVIVFVCRDFYMMGLRHIALQYMIYVPVSYWGKIRTACLMAYITILILNPYMLMSWQDAPWWHGVESVLLLACLFMTVWSAYRYTYDFVREFRSKQV